MSKPLKDKVILISGASGGIGSQCAKECAELGANVFIAGRNRDTLDSLAKDYDGMTALCYDVTNVGEIKRAFSTIHKTHGKLDGLVNCAGDMLDAPLIMTRPEQIDAQFAVNSTSALLHCQYASKLMIRNQSGSIVCLGSQVAEQGSAGQVAYAMSKSALSGLVRSLSKELGSMGIRVNAVAPGFIETTLTQKYSDDKRSQIIASSAIKRLGQPTDVSALILFLLFDASKYITGQVIGVDGGLTL